MRISSHTDVYGPSEDDYWLFIENSMTHVFVSFRPPYLCPSEGHKHGVSIHSLVNLNKTFPRISRARNIAQTWIWIDCESLFEYSCSFSSLILDFICWMVLMMVWKWKPAINRSARFVRDVLRTYIWKISIIGITAFPLKLIASNMNCFFNFSSIRVVFVQGWTLSR